MHKSDFDIYGLVAIFNFSQNLAENQYISGGFLRILVPSQILAPPWHFWKKLDNYCSFITDSFPRSHTQEWFWQLLCKDNILFTTEASGDQDLDILRTLAASKISATQAIPENFEKHCNWLTSKIPYKKVILTIIVQWQFLIFHKI